MTGPAVRAHAWLPRATCDADCLPAGAAHASRRVIVALRVARRITLLLLFAPALPLLAWCYQAGRSPERSTAGCCCGVWGCEITLSGGPIRNLPGVLVVSDHMSWLDILTIGAVLPSSRWRASPVSFVARADVAVNVAVRMMDRIVRVIPIERASLRQLPAVVATVAARLYAGHTVVAFPEGTTWCGRPATIGLARRREVGDRAQRTIASGLGAVLSGDVPGGRRHRPTGPAAAAALPPPGRPGLDCPGLHRRRHIVAFDRPADGRAAHGGPHLRRISAAAGRGSPGAGPSLPGGDSRHRSAEPRSRAAPVRARVLSTKAPAQLPISLPPRPASSMGVGILGRSWSTWITLPPPRCTPLPSRR